MAWVRLHDAAMTHPKIGKLSDKAFRLWVWGLSYCQMYLTDGLIEPSAIPLRLKRASEGLLQVGLWEPYAAGFKVHDYLDWNDSKEIVMQKRNAAKERMTAVRERTTPYVRERTSGIVQDHSRANVPCSVGSSNALTGKIVEDEIAERAGRFLERYQALYRQFRRGAVCKIKPALDWDRCCDLCRLWDDARLEKLAAVFLQTDDEWISRTDRGFGVFCARASWADDRLKQAESGAA